MGLDFKKKLGKVQDALYPTPGSVTTEQGRLGVFGAGPLGFAKEALANLYAQGFYSQKAKADGMTIPVGMEGKEIPRSIFNEYALFNFKGMHYGLAADPSKDYYDQSGGPTKLMGGTKARNISYATLVDYFDSDTLSHIRYSKSDFLYCKYYKKIPPNHLITLRRFPMPCFDNIYDLKLKPKPETDKAGNVINSGDLPGYMPAAYTAVTYMGEAAGNPMNELLKYTYGLSFKEIEGKMESHSTSDEGYTSQPFYSKIGGIGRAIADTSQGVSAGEKFRKQNFTTGDALGTTYANFVLGPVNVVNKTSVRSESGLHFTNDLTLNFEYDLKSLAFVNPKIAMIDIMTNMISMTYNNANFFGGGHRFYGSGGFVASQFGDIAKLRAGDFSGYVGTVVKDVSDGMKNVFGDGNGGFSWDSVKDGALAVGKNYLGNMLGSFLGSQVGAATGTFATKAFISAEPTGDWHVTVGNPMNPIVMMGNMICDNSIMTLGEGLSVDDFPVEAKFAITLKHGKPRDKGDMENMFNMGRGRIYSSAQGMDSILHLGDTPYTIYGVIDPPGKKGIQKSANEQANIDAENEKNKTAGDPNGLPPKAGNMEGANILDQIAQNRGVTPKMISQIISMSTDS